MKTCHLIPSLAAIALLTLTPTVVQAQLALAGTNYLQTFDDLDPGLPAGWMVCTNAHATNLGTTVIFATNHVSWGTQTGQFQNSASTSNAGTNLLGGETATLQSGYTNRAPAIRQAASFGDPGAAFVLNLTNTACRAGFRLDLVFLMLSVQSHSTTWTVDYATGNDPTNFISAATYNDPGVFGSTHATVSFGGALDNKNSNVWIRIAALTVSTGSGYRDTFGVDNFSLFWTNLSSLNPPRSTGIIITNGNVQIDFTGDSGDTVSSFTLQSAAQAGGAFSDTAATITQAGPGLFQAACPMSGLQQFFTVKRR